MVFLSCLNKRYYCCDANCPALIGDITEFDAQDIVAIELVKGSMGSRSSIFFNHKGLERQSGDDSNFGLRSLEVAGSPNAVLFTKENYDSFKELKEKVGTEEVILGLSGGVDSTVAAVLLHKAIGDQLKCVFVNNGLLRLNEEKEIEEMFKNNFKVEINCIFRYFISYW